MSLQLYAFRRFAVFRSQGFWVFLTMAFLNLYGCGGGNNVVTPPVRVTGPNRLVFVAIDPPKQGIYTVNPNGSNLVQVVSGPNSGSAADTRFSPDGSQIAFDSGSGILSIDLINADGSIPKRGGAVLPGLFAGQPSFSPDGSRLLFAGGSGVNDISSIKVDGTDLRLIVKGDKGGSKPVYSPDGKHILCLQSLHVLGATTSTSHIVVMNIDGTGQRTLTTTGNQWEANYSPDGKRIVYTSDFHIWVMDADGSHQQQLTTAPSTDHLPVFSPDGTKIAFASNRGSVDESSFYSGSYVWMMNADGTGQVRIEVAGGSPTGMYGLDWR